MPVVIFRLSAFRVRRAEIKFYLFIYLSYLHLEILHVFTSGCESYHMSDITTIYENVFMYVKIILNRFLNRLYIYTS